MDKLDGHPDFMGEFVPDNADVCEHGSLRRKCPICERDEEIRLLREEIDHAKTARDMYRRAALGWLNDALASTSEVEQLRGLLFRARKFVEDDVLMADAITRHAPLPPDAQAVHDYTECLSERLLREIDSLLTNTPPTSPAPAKDTP